MGKSIDISGESEKSACGVGFIASRQNKLDRRIVDLGLSALACVEHRGACAIDEVTSDGAGLMLDIPYALLGREPGSFSLATVFLTGTDFQNRQALELFEQGVQAFEMKVLEEREVPTDPSVFQGRSLTPIPKCVQVVVSWPPFSRTRSAYERLLYQVKQKTRTLLKKYKLDQILSFVSFSSTSVVYKALTLGNALAAFYPDLQEPEFRSRYALFHRRFSTNTVSTWDKAQPFRLIAHNGEINTIAANRAWSYSREQALGLPVDELLTHEGISDSGSLNEMVEAMKYRSDMGYVNDILAIMVPPAERRASYFELWGRAMEAWDGPALIAFCDGATIGARLDRNGFRPARWGLTKDYLYVASEMGVFDFPPQEIIKSRSLRAGSGISFSLSHQKLEIEIPEKPSDFRNVPLNANTQPLVSTKRYEDRPYDPLKKFVFSYTEEDLSRVLFPMTAEGKEPIGSMGDTARPQFLSDEPRPFFDYFYQHFAQVTNPPVDYIREQNVTDLRVYLGKKPNVFITSDLIPPTPALELRSLLLTPALMQEIYDLRNDSIKRAQLGAYVVPTLYERGSSQEEYYRRIDEIAEEALQASYREYPILVLSDRDADFERLPLPSLLVLAAVTRKLDEWGVGLRTALVVDSGEVRSAHHLATLVAFGASAVCPWLAFAAARNESHKSITHLPQEEREENLRNALELGFLRIMSKMGISVARSYHCSRLFTPLGLGPEITERYFPKNPSPVGGLSLEGFYRQVQRDLPSPPESDKPRLRSTYQFREHARRKEGEKHSMTAEQSKALHRAVREEDPEEQWKLYEAYLESGKENGVTGIRDLLELVPSGSDDADEVCKTEELLPLFGSGAMSFGAISAESQRDIIKAMNITGGRSNSGEGGENPYYFVDGTTASVKQIASARFGVTGEYVIAGRELQIKIAQGAKPGEGGQLMRVKVSEEIARARFASPGIDLISPPPLHDIYSIEDLKELIYELRQFHPAARISVKLVSGTEIGTIAVGVAKAGADTIHVAGGNGGTGAASLGSMKHAGLPFELGLVEVNHALTRNGLRKHVRLRTDGGLSTGKDLVIAAILGADEFDFGKLLLISEGCIMARLCEKNTCPVGIATHDEKFKAKYKGEVEHVVALLNLLARDVQNHLRSLRIRDLAALKGRTDLLKVSRVHEKLVEERGVDLSALLEPFEPSESSGRNPLAQGVGTLNEKILEEVTQRGGERQFKFAIRNTDRAVPSRLSGELASRAKEERQSGKEPSHRPTLLHFQGYAGHGFGFLVPKSLSLRLEGGANDSAGKSLDGGRIVICPPKGSQFDPAKNAIIGNVALYGATSGTFYAYGQAGDRFAVRNSGAAAVIEGAGMHACEYMTGGTVVILGPVSKNVGAGMTGGELYLLDPVEAMINDEYIGKVPPSEEEQAKLEGLLRDYHQETGSETAKALLSDWGETLRRLVRYAPVY